MEVLNFSVLKDVSKLTQVEERVCVKFSVMYLSLYAVALHTD